MGTICSDSHLLQVLNESSLSLSQAAVPSIHLPEAQFLCLLEEGYCTKVRRQSDVLV